jgi:tRNA-2-methylthio-N6-dimethylallyladenosine synthase
MVDDVPEGEKGRRVFEITDLQHNISLERNRAMVGTQERVLIEGPSRKSDFEYMGRTDSNKTVVLSRNGEHAGEYVRVEITRVTSATLFGDVVRGGGSV